jgi:hypothetical protein
MNMSTDNHRRTTLKKFIAVNMTENPRFNELLASMDKLPTEYIEELYRELGAIEPLKVIGTQTMTVEATRKLRDKINLTLRYHE